MKNIAAIAASGVMALAVSACDVEQTEEGEAPEVDYQAGELPQYDVDTADVDVETEERTVDVPVVDVEEAEEGQQ